MDAVEASGHHNGWPQLRGDDWIQTRETVHMWTQIVGKIRMAHTPMLNHWWHVTLYVTPRGLTTSKIPYGAGAYDIEFDFCDHRLHIRSSNGTAGAVALETKSVAEFHAEVFETLGRLGIEASIRAVPNEVDSAIPFAQDYQHASYDPEAIWLFWQQLVQADRVLNDFRSHFRGKASPVHYFWGGMDLAYARFSGRAAPAHPGGVPNCADWVMVEGYSHELSSCGFWPAKAMEPCTTKATGCTSFPMRTSAPRRTPTASCCGSFTPLTRRPRRQDTGTARALRWIRTAGGGDVVDGHSDPGGSHMNAIPGIDVSIPPSGTGWVECQRLHLRRCAQCGHIGCCDNSPAQHATAHERSTGHPVIRSFEPGEDWFFHYPSARYFDGPELAPPAHRPLDQSVPGPASRVPTDWQQHLH
jgi:hypothetical protein